MVCRFPASGKRTLEQRGLGTFCRPSCLILLLQQSPGEKLFPAAHFSTVPPLFYHQVKHNLCVVSPMVQRKLRCLRMLHAWGCTIRAHTEPLPRKGAGSVHPGACQQPGGPKCLTEVLTILLYYSSDRETPEPKQRWLFFWQKDCLKSAQLETQCHRKVCWWKRKLCLLELT